MVNKEDIDKVFDELISNWSVKCGQHLTITNKSILASFDKFHEKYCGEKPRKSEVALFTDNNGNEVFFKKGRKMSVDFTDKEIRDNYEEYGELNLTHNHPRGSTRACAEALSSGDVSFLTYNYRPYGKRPDGSEGYLVGEEGVYPIKSISCESANGSRMTLVRGDNFSKEDESKLGEAGKQLDNYHMNYYRDYYENLSKIRSNTNLNEFNNIEDYETYLHKETIKKVGIFEKNKDFKDIQKMFRDANCKLTYTFPFEYQVGLWE